MDSIFPDGVWYRAGTIFSDFPNHMVDLPTKKLEKSSVSSPLGGDNRFFLDDLYLQCEL